MAKTNIPEPILQAIQIENLRISANQGELVSIGAETSGVEFSKSSVVRGARINTVQYIGIAADEPKRIAKHKDKTDVLMPLVEARWEESDCRKWCEQNGLLSPVYTTSARDGCFFCFQQGIEQLRNLRHNYPDLWALMLKWDNDSPVTFHADGHTVHDFDKRFELEDEGLIDPNEKFRWSMLENQQMRLF